MTDLERNILRELKNGDEKAFEYLFRTYYQPLYNYALEILKKEHPAEEVVEETFLKIWENRKNIDIQNSLKAYLFKSVYHQCLNLFKHQKIVSQYETFFKNHILPDESSDLQDYEYPLSRIIETELSQIIDTAIENLPVQSRKIFKMSRFENLKNEEIAHKLNISINTVKTHISRALLKLREELKEYLPIFLLILLQK